MIEVQYVLFIALRLYIFTFNVLRSFTHIPGIWILDFRTLFFLPFNSQIFINILFLSILIRWPTIRISSFLCRLLSVVSRYLYNHFISWLFIITQLQCSISGPCIFPIILLFYTFNFISLSLKIHVSFSPAVNGFTIVLCIFILTPLLIW